MAETKHGMLVLMAECTGGLRAHGETLASWAQAAEGEKTLTSQAAAGEVVGGEAGRGGVV